MGILGCGRGRNGMGIGIVGVKDGDVKIGLWKEDCLISLGGMRRR